ncbi:MAG: SDR family oxidoreductase [Alphaproteobacteria bacterium]|nr:SDR family oxidoreductase [Alphaproteobacteria bacterium]
MEPVLIVTGGSQGIGAAVARLAGQRGWAVALSYVRSRDLAESVASDIRAAGGRASAIQAEMADEASVVQLFRTVDSELGPVSGLVNNAGTTGPIRLIEHITPAILDEVMGVNVRGAFIATREAAARMRTDRAGRGGSIVNVSSRAAELGGAGEWVHYAASKGAMDSLTIGSARELAPFGIRVNAVGPGLIETDLHARAGAPDRLERLKGGVPMGRTGTAEEVAKVVLWLLSDEASYVSAALIPVSGGR